MSGTDLYLAERMMALRVAEEHRQADAQRLLSEVQAGRAGWLGRQRARALSQLGQVFVSLGWRLLQDASRPQTLRPEGRASGRA